MPCKNSIKIYVENGYYHVYNRGVEKRIIFQDDQDYHVLLNYLKEYLLPPTDAYKSLKTFDVQGGSLNVLNVTFRAFPRTHKNYHDKIELLAYCLMPNHFHLLLKQNGKNSMEMFMRSVFTRYSMFFNKKYDRVGKLFQGHYKAVIILNDSYLLHLSRYIHLNPSEYTKNLVGAYSSYGDYLDVRKTPWLKPEFILQFFKEAGKDFLQGTNTYKDFVEKYKEDSEEVLGKLILE